MNYFYVVSAFIYSVVVHSAEGKICDGFFSNGIEDKVSGASWLSCPQDEEPFYYTECCATNQTLRCCPRGSFIEYFDEQLVMIISIVVISICVVLIILTLVCCFSSSCPLYNLCKVKYSQDGIIAYSAREQEPLTGASMEEIEQKSYQPNNVKIKLMDEV